MDIGQLQSSWEPFGDHGMKLVAFKTIHVHAFDITYGTLDFGLAKDKFDLVSYFSSENYHFQ